MLATSTYTRGPYHVFLIFPMVKKNFFLPKRPWPNDAPKYATDDSDENGALSVMISIDKKVRTSLFKFQSHICYQNQIQSCFQSEAQFTHPQD